MHNRRAHTNRPWVALLTIVAVLAVGLRIAGVGRGGAHHPNVLAMPTPAKTGASSLARVGRAQVTIPAGWSRVERGRDHATWAAANHASSVTLGAMVASAQPLARVLSGGVTDLRRSVPGLVGAPRMSAASPTDASVDFDVVRNHMHIHVRQRWHRDEGAQLDAVATWTWSRGAARPPTRAPRVQ